VPAVSHAQSYISPIYVLVFPNGHNWDIKEAFVSPEQCEAAIKQFDKDMGSTNGAKCVVYRISPLG
jgi:hypothetical protein